MGLLGHVETAKLSPQWVYHLAVSPVVYESFHISVYSPASALSDSLF